MSIIKKLVIPVAGYGTRFLPATKAQPKEMLPIVDKPIIQYVVEEAVKSGITDVILVTGSGKRAVEDHFSYNFEIQHFLKSVGKEEDREALKKIADMANFIFVRQKGPYGNGTPVLCAKAIIGNEPFAVVWGDDFWQCPKEPQIKQLMNVFEKYGDPVLTAKDISKADTSKYGVIDGTELGGGVLEVKKLVEKPGPEKAPSLVGSFGGYILTPDIFEALENTKLGKGGELWLVDAIVKLMKHRPVYAKKVIGKYYDTGSKIGYLCANVEFALQRPDLKNDFKKYLKSLNIK
ncbi:MAG: UTP-glucose-1-phosphate uridylyltransferase [Parcubacteria group bacterium GW2011_GWC2_38_7]|nr:MAG: UTP-glucose-1-phosphate uridylyltransferase [Parcubacteria group bacterium GW2011_GWC2_38_7]